MAIIYDKAPSSLNKFKTYQDDDVVTVTFDNTIQLPNYNDRDYAIIANQAINKTVVLRGSRQYTASTYFITTINKIPRNIQQRIAGGNSTSWSNMVAIYNFFASEFGYNQITNNKKQTKAKKLRMCDEKDGDGSDCHYPMEDMVYMSDGMWMHKNDCWW